MGCHIEGGSPGNSKMSKFLSFGQFRTINGDVENFGIFAFFENCPFSHYFQNLGPLMSTKVTFSDMCMERTLFLLK